MSSGSHVKAAMPKVKGTVSFKAQNARRVGSSSQPKRHRPSPPSDDEGQEEEEDDESDDEADVESEADTDDEIAAAQSGKSKKTSKRKRRATSPSTFGATLEGLLGTSERERKSQQKGQPAILSLAPHVRRSAQSSRLNEKASRIAVEAKKKRLERARVKDVIGGWGAPGQVLKTAEGDEMEVDIEENDKIKEWQLQGGSQAYEKKLRKVAQRGVVKLFNAIRAAQNTTTDDVEIVKGTSKEDRNLKTAASNTLKGENVLGGKAKAVTELSKNNFFDLIRSGAKATAAH